MLVRQIIRRRQSKVLKHAGPFTITCAEIFTEREQGACVLEEHCSLHTAVRLHIHTNFSTRVTICEHRTRMRQLQLRAYNNLLVMQQTTARWPCQMAIDQERSKCPGLSKPRARPWDASP